ncbi:MAG TPA: alpha/beta family hydrolase [Gemmatimonadales bacterium]|nr:alpha/beta family hydrolase [Gemmatimonadales bacterium]
MALFADRHDAGRRLAAALQRYAGRDDLLVLGLPRGGVPVAWEVAQALHAPLDVFVVRKLGVPGHEELAMGAIASGGVVVTVPELLDTLGIPPAVVERAARLEAQEVARREHLYRGDRPFPDVRGRTVLLVDDGLATGATMRAAVEALRRLGPREVVVAVPVGAPETCAEFQQDVAETICATTPSPFQAVGLWYRDFEQTSDAEVQALLAPPLMEVEREITLDLGPVRLAATLGVPAARRGVVLFAHGSGSSRHSPRNRYVAGELQRAGFATVLADLLTEAEERADAVDAHLRFDIGMLAERLAGIVDQLGRLPETRGLPVGLFGASTGGGAALVAAAGRPDAVRAVVSRGGRPDLAGAALARVRAPTLLVVGGRDDVVIELNETARARMPGEVRLEIVPGATHLFEEPGALEAVARLAVAWFERWLGRGPAPAAPG